MNSSHLVGGLPLGLLISLEYQSIILDAHRLSFILATCPSHLILLRRVSRTMSCTPDISLIVSSLILSLMEIFNILLSIALSATASLVSSAFVKDHVSLPQLMAGKTVLLKVEIARIYLLWR